MTSKKELSERDICTKYITPALEKAGWNLRTQLREDVYLTDGPIYVKGNMTARGKRKRADYVLYYKLNIPIAVVEAKNNTHSASAGIQQSLEYARLLKVPFAYSSNGDSFREHDKTQSNGQIERDLALNEFPSPQMLWERYRKYNNIENKEQEDIVTQDYSFDDVNKKPRYYQQVAINKTVEAIAKGKKRILLTMATGTGKTYTAFQIIYRLWKSRNKKRILFLADRNVLIDQAKRGDFCHFGDKMTVVKQKNIDKSYEIYLALYQGLTNYDEDKDAYREFTPNFFDLIVVDECHRGSADANSEWRKILEYFNNATHIGLTATPKETKDVSNIEYFGDPIYTYSLKQGIQDGFLAPYKVLRVLLNIDQDGWRPEKGKTDKKGVLVEDRHYTTKDFDKTLFIDERTVTVAKRVTEFLKKTNPYSKTIVFCRSIEHARLMRDAIAIENSDMMAQNDKFVMQITGDNEEGKMELGNFTDPYETYPVVATTSKLMTTGVDAQTCRLIVLDSPIHSKTEFKQIIGRGTRINEEFDKMFFTIMDFHHVTEQFSDPNFDGEPVRIKVVMEDKEIETPEGEINGVPVLDEDGKEVVFTSPEQPPDIIKGGEITHEPSEKVYVDGVYVAILNERVQYLDGGGKLITNLFKDTKTKICGQYQSLDDFLNKWDEADKKQVIIDELMEQGVSIDNLKEVINKKVDIFDLICHVAFGQPPLTRAERANNVKKRDYFTKYGEQARKVLEALLDKYADEGIENIENTQILQVNPLDKFGSPLEIVEFFGGEEQYSKAITELGQEIYRKVV